MYQRCVLATLVKVSNRNVNWTDNEDYKTCTFIVWTKFGKQTIHSTFGVEKANMLLNWWIIRKQYVTAPDIEHESERDRERESQFHKHLYPFEFEIRSSGLKKYPLRKVNQSVNRINIIAAWLTWKVELTLNTLWVTCNFWGYRSSFEQMMS